MAADVDGDGAFEIIPGASTINSDGTLRCTTGIGHGDAMHVGELVAGCKGSRCTSVHETCRGRDCHDASTCKYYFNVTGGGTTGRGTADYVGVGDETAAIVFVEATPATSIAAPVPRLPPMLGATSSSTGTPMNGVRR